MKIITDNKPYIGEKRLITDEQKIKDNLEEEKIVIREQENNNSTHIHTWSMLQWRIGNERHQ